jgi:hypothetical protein
VARRRHEEGYVYAALRCQDQTVTIHLGWGGGLAGDDEIPKLLVDYVHHILAHLFMRCKNMELFDPPARFLLRETSETYDMI